MAKVKVIRAGGNIKKWWNRKTKNFQAHKFVPEVGFIAPPKNIVIPITYFTPQVFNDQFIQADLMKVEIGNLGWVKRQGRNFVIQEVFVPGQTVHGTETLMSPGGQADLVTQEILTRPNGAEIYNGIRYWGHCHVHMGTWASGPDNDQMMEFVNDCDDYFIRCIFNKEGRMEVTLYLIEENLVIKDAPWEVLGERQPIDPARRAYWQQVIKDKVVIEKLPPVTYPTYNYSYANAQDGFDSDAGVDTGFKGDRTVY